MLVKYLSKPFSNSLKVFSLSRHQRYNFGYSVGNPYHEPIRVSTIDLYREFTEKNPSAVALNSYSQNTTFTYEQLYSKAEELATGLIKNFNLKPKDRIGIYAYNKFEWVVVQLASAMADLILVNINPAYQSDELAYTIEKVGLSVLFLNDKFRHLDYIKIVRAVVPEVETNNPYDIRSKRFPTLKGIVRMNSDDSYIKGFVNYTDLSEPVQRALLPGKIHF